MQRRGRLDGWMNGCVAKRERGDQHRATSRSCAVRAVYAVQWRARGRMNGALEEEKKKENGPSHKHKHRPPPGQLGCTVPMETDRPAWPLLGLSTCLPACFTHFIHLIHSLTLIPAAAYNQWLSLPATEQPPVHPHHPPKKPLPPSAGPRRLLR